MPKIPTASLFGHCGLSCADQVQILSPDLSSDAAFPAKLFESDSFNGVWKNQVYSPKNLRTGLLDQIKGPSSPSLYFHL